MSSTFHPQWANHAEQSTLSPLAKHQLTMASRQRPSRLVWIPLYFIIYMSTCYSAGRKEQCPGDARLQHHHALQEQGRLQRLWYLPWNVPPQYHWKGFYPFRVEQIADASRTVVSWGTVWVQSWKVNNWHDFFTEAASGKVWWAEETPAYCPYRDLTKAFDLVSRVCSLSCGEWDATQAPKDDHVFPWRHARNRPVRRLGYVLASTLFGIFFSLLLSYALSQSEDGVYLHTRSDGNLFNLTRLPAKTKVRKVLLRDTLRVPYSDSSAPSHTLVACLVSPLVSRRPTSLAKTSAAHQVSPLATTLSKWWRTSLT